jgi:hypothetical protein
MKTLTFPGFSETNLKAKRTDSYPVSSRKNPVQPQLIQLQEKAFTQAKRLQPKSVSEAHRAMLINYSFDRRFFW